MSIKFYCGLPFYKIFGGLTAIHEVKLPDTPVSLVSVSANPWSHGYVVFFTNPNIWMLDVPRNLPLDSFLSENSPYVYKSWCAHEEHDINFFKRRFKIAMLEGKDVPEPKEFLQQCSSTLVISWLKLCVVMAAYKYATLPESIFPLIPMLMDYCGVLAEDHEHIVPVKQLQEASRRRFFQRLTALTEREEGIRDQERKLFSKESKLELRSALKEYSRFRSAEAFGSPADVAFYLDCENAYYKRIAFPTKIDMDATEQKIISEGTQFLARLRDTWVVGTRVSPVELILGCFYNVHEQLVTNRKKAAAKALADIMNNAEKHIIPMGLSEKERERFLVQQKKQCVTNYLTYLSRLNEIAQAKVKAGAKK